MDRSSSEPFELEWDRLLQSYREAIPDREPGVNFMPLLWEKIEARQIYTLRFKRLTQVFVGAAAVICVVLMNVNFGPASQVLAQGASYVDVLAAANPTENLLALGIAHADGVDLNQ